MSRPLLEGPGRVLTCLPARFITDLADSLDTTRHACPHLHPFRERLQQEMIARSQQPPWALPDMLATRADLRLAWLEQLMHLWSPGQLALLHMSTRLAVVCGNQTGNMQLALGNVLRQCRERLAQREAFLRQRDMVQEAWTHAEKTLYRWRSGEFAAWSPAGRCYIALEELRWGPFGDAMRLSAPHERVRLKEMLRERATGLLATSVEAAPRTRHFYSRWLSTPSSAGLMDYKDTLSWLGAWSDGEHHPVSRSVTQTWQSVALGMPRLCSAARLVDAMVEELFSEG